MEENNLMKILIYDDDGTSHVDTFVSALEFSFSEFRASRIIHNYRIKRVSGKDVVEGICFRDAKVFIMPGGRDIPYLRKLKGQGIANLKAFVSEGGNYFGVCAGAYFASTFCEFEKGTDIEVCGERDLKFYPGVAKGSVYPDFHYDSEVAARIVQVQLEEPFHRPGIDSILTAYHNGGCEFIMDEDSAKTNIETVGRYLDFPEKIAVVLCKFDKGKVLLSGVHPEINYKYLKGRSKYSPEQLTSLSNASEKQQEFLHTLLLLLL
ncbi:uncharacterized protein LOC135684665 [Rhopilema esculentum]|uniref:uncharacterized protein LOC135684665 n=1 Tax=Rhopilema esculentum TaxID=499914 RepID=UPI0031DAAACC|eukprot:gene16641-8078_t